MRSVAVLYQVYTIPPVVNPVEKRVEGTATVRSTKLNEQPLFVQPVVKPGCTTGLTNRVVQPV